MKATLTLILLALQAHALDYPHVTAEPQKTGWPLTTEERAYVVDKLEYEQSPDVCHSSSTVSTALAV